MPKRVVWVVLCGCLLGVSGVAQAQMAAPGGIAGVVRLASDNSAVPGARVLLLGTRRAATTDSEGVFELLNVAPGTYELLAERDALAAPRQTVTVVAAPSSMSMCRYRRRCFTRN